MSLNGAPEKSMRFNLTSRLAKMNAVTATIVLGAQWGDEGKGRVTDFFAESADFVVRYQGGNNAGHTITIGDRS